ncbi:MAG: DUF1217 domain-containing protein [Rubellimicrobium sp.]|nr:DUF1217 domain-containing protein [Rubellimicrobium sp.]
MTFQPILPLGGLPGWAFLNRTLARQQAAFAASAPVQRATDYFRANIGKATSAESLVSDRRLLEVALGAFGLDADIDARAFIRKVLEGGTADERALSSRLGDKRYARLAAAFGYGDPVPPDDPRRYADDIMARIARREIDAAAIGQDDILREALDLTPALDGILATTTGTRTRWLVLMDDPSLRRSFETVLDLPANLDHLDINSRLAAFMDAARSAFGTDDLADLASGPGADALTHRFLLRAQAAATGGTADPATTDDFAEEIIARFVARQFEAAVGEQDNDLRLALNLQPALAELLETTTGDNARWFALMGNPPLRSLFETALGLPTGFGRLDIDRQLDAFKEFSRAAFGTDDLADLASGPGAAALTRRFLVRAQAAAFSTAQNPAATALALLSSAPPVHWPGIYGGR